MSAIAHAVVESLFRRALPGVAEWPTAKIVVKSTDNIEIELNGDELPLVRVLALAGFACALGDEDGPYKVDGGRYTCGLIELCGHETFFLVRTDVTDAEQADLETFARRLPFAGEDL